MEVDACDQAAHAERWRGLRWLDKVLGTIAATVLFLLMAIVFADVTSRYLFAAPLRGTFEFTELGLVVLIFCGLPLVSRSGEHVTMDILAGAGSRVMARASAIGTNVLMALLLAGAAVLIWQRAGRAVRDADVTAALNLPLAPFIYLMAAMLAVAALIHALIALDHLRSGTNKQKDKQ